MILNTCLIYSFGRIHSKSTFCCYQFQQLNLLFSLTPFTYISYMYISSPWMTALFGTNKFNKFALEYNFHKCSLFYVFRSHAVSHTTNMLPGHPRVSSLHLNGHTKGHVQPLSCLSSEKSGFDRCKRDGRLPAPETDIHGRTGFHLNPCNSRHPCNPCHPCNSPSSSHRSRRV